MVIKFVTLYFALLSAKRSSLECFFSFYFPSKHFVFLGTLNFSPRTVTKKSIAVESTKSIKIRMPEQSNDYRVVTFGSGGVGKSSLGRVVVRWEKKKRKSFLLLCCPPTSKWKHGAWADKKIISIRPERDPHANENISREMFYSFEGTSLFRLLIFTHETDSPKCVYSIISFPSISVLRFIKGTFPTNYIPTIEDTYRQVCVHHLTFDNWLASRAGMLEGDKNIFFLARMLAANIYSLEIIICILNY